MSLEKIVESVKKHKTSIVLASAILATAAADIYSTVQGVQAKGINHESSELAKSLMHQFGPVLGVSLAKTLFLPIIPIGDWLHKKLFGINHLVSYFAIIGQTYGAASWYIF